MAARRGVSVHAAVEVKGLSQDGFQASHSKGRVLDVFQVAGVAVESCTVQYDDVSVKDRLFHNARSISF